MSGDTSTGVLSPSLLELKYLNYLDLSHNYFLEIPIPNFICSLNKLTYLNLSSNSQDRPNWGRSQNRGAADGLEDIFIHHGRTIMKDDTENCLTKTPQSSRSYGEALHKRTTVFSVVGWSFHPFNTSHRHYKSCNDPTIKARPIARRRDLIYTHWWSPKRRYTNIISKNTTLLLFSHC